MLGRLRLSEQAFAELPALTCHVDVSRTCVVVLSDTFMLLNYTSASS